MLLLYQSWSTGWKEGRNEMFYLTTRSTHFIYGYMALDIWYSTTQIVREETHCRNMDYSFRLTARVILYAPSHSLYSFCGCMFGRIMGTLQYGMMFFVFKEHRWSTTATFSYLGFLLGLPQP